MRWKKFKNFKCFCCIIFCIVLLSLWTFTALFSNSSAVFDNNNDPTKNFLNDKIVGDGDESTSFTLKRNPNKIADGQQLLYGDLPCIINGEQILTCLRDNNEEVYIPFKSFLSKYYSVTGHVTRRQDGEDVFEWWHSSTKVHHKLWTGKYDPRKVFGTFSTYNVEHRDRVKCISGTDGVPLSTQWNHTTPYHYPIQIAQFALEHYSKNLTEPPPMIIVYETGDTTKEVWQKAPESIKTTVLERLYDAQRNSNVLHFKTNSAVDSPGIFVNLENNSSKLHLVRFFIKFMSNAIGDSIVDDGSFTVTVEKLDTKTFFYMHYVQNDDLVRTAEPNQIFLGIGVRMKNRWRRITRNLWTDFNKTFMILMGAKKQKRLKLTPDLLRFVSISFRGEGYLDDFSQRTSSHMDHFFDGADWFLANQAENGGFPITVRRSFGELKLSLKPNWYSAMAQGHAMSTLCRAYYVTGDEKYKNSAISASKLYRVDAPDGGVRNHFMGLYPWYEEYPTTPGTFVLNGFIYALIGLYDAINLCSSKVDGTDDVDGAVEELKKLYADGLASLKKLLPLYDTGSRSMYDLRHVSFGSPPNVARWDYHALHVFQLNWLYNIENEQSFKTTADRWLFYSKGGHVGQQPYNVNER